MEQKIYFETKRLVIRNFTEDDYKDLYEYLSDPVTYIYEPGRPITLNESKKLCKERNKSNIFIAVELRKEKKLIGHIYFNKIEPKEYNIFEIGYIFNKGFQGYGYATEASKKVMEYGFKKLKIHKIIAYCNPKNKKSWKLLERLGMKREGNFKQNAYFRKNDNGEPIWHDAYSYGLLGENFGTAPTLY
jgi:RimJ/RimL family protein N-acetyltransferase